MSKSTDLRLETGAGADRKRIHLREICDDAAAPLDTVGQHLRAARLRRGDELAAIARVLKIRKDHLEALEEDRQDALPGRAYAIGFMRSYADYLGLDAAETVERFKREIAERGEEHVSVPLLERPHDERRLPQGWLVIALVLIVALAFGLWRLAHSASVYFDPPALPAPSQVHLRPLLPKSAAGLHKLASHSAAPKAPTNTVAKGPMEATTATGASPQMPAVSGPAAATSASPQAASVSAVAAQMRGLPKGQAYGLHNTSAKVMLTALKPVHVLVLGPAPGKMLFMDQTIQPGDTYRVPDLPGTTLTTTDPAALAVTLNGRLLGLAGVPGATLTGQSLAPRALRNLFNLGSQH